MGCALLVQNKCICSLFESSYSVVAKSYFGGLILELMPITLNPKPRLQGRRPDGTDAGLRQSFLASGTALNPRRPNIAKSFN